MPSLPLPSPFVQFSGNYGRTKRSLCTSSLLRVIPFIYFAHSKYIGTITNVVLSTHIVKALCSCSKVKLFGNKLICVWGYKDWNKMGSQKTLKAKWNHKIEIFLLVAWRQVLFEAASKKGCGVLSYEKMLSKWRLLVWVGWKSAIGRLNVIGYHGTILILKQKQKIRFVHDITLLKHCTFVKLFFTSLV